MNGLRGVKGLLLVALLCVGAQAVAGEGGPRRDDPQEVAAIKALVEKLNQAWKSPEQISLLTGFLSDKAFAFAMPRPGQPDQARVMNKAEMCDSVQKFVAQKDPNFEHTHEVKSIHTFGPLGFEIGVSRDVAPDGRRQETEVVNFFAKDETGWKLLFSSFGGPLRAALRAPESDAEVVRRLALDFVDSFGLGASPPRTKIEDILADDVAFVWSNGKAATGKATCLEWRAKALEEVRGAFKTFALRYDIRSVRLFADTAVVLGKLDISGTPKEGDQPFRREVWETLIFAKAGAGWRLIEEHSTPASAQ